MTHVFGLTDCVSFARESGQRDWGRISGFFKIQTHSIAPNLHFLLKPGEPPLILKLVPCHLEDLDLRVVGTNGVSGQFHHPWDLDWERPVAWPHADIAAERAAWNQHVAQGDGDIFGLSSRSYPALFARFDLPTEHTRLRVRAWISQCQAKLAAWEKGA